MIGLKTIIRIFCLVSPILALSLSALAETTEEVQTPKIDGFQADYLLELDRIEDRILLLARELPEEVYSASPGDGIHSLAECFNKSTAISREALIKLDTLKRSSLGPPATKKKGIDDDLAEVLNLLRQTAIDIDDEGLERKIDYKGRRLTARGLLIFALIRQAEGLGHAALHAEAVGHPPRWIREQRSSQKHDD